MIIYLGIGTNLGNREKNLRDALCLLDTKVGTQLACSSIYRSRPQGFVSDNDFANIVVAYETERTLEEVLLLTQQIERDLGRTQKSVDGIYHDRIIDIDLLQAKDGDCMLEHHSPTLIIPHPRMHERDFVTIPLQEIEQLLSTAL
jgi:2-amino-4-hydroxy-6-hydroxymethyldihydropteridine diphosphokinase